MVQRSSKREYAEAVRGRYCRAGKREKGRILDEFVAATGYHRVYARRLLRPAPVAVERTPRPQPARRQYGPAEQALLQACWLVADAICSKRLSPFLPELLGRLAACEALPPEATAEAVERVGRMSAATIDRLLRSERARGPGRGRSLTKPGTLLKGQVPIKTFADWDGTRPGFLEIDLVAHCGASGAGEFLLTLSTVDVATGWSCCLGVRNKGQLAIETAVEHLRALVPFPVLGLASDNGSEFLNRTLVAYCAAHRITFTRSRPYQKNDNCHVEQKNWSVVRRLVGYARYELFALAPLNRLYRLADDYVNFLQPVLKLVDKTRDGAQVRKRYDVAQTPYRRLLASGALPSAEAAARRTRSEALHPVQLKQAIEVAQRALEARAIRTGSLAVAPAGRAIEPTPRRPDRGPGAAGAASRDHRCPVEPRRAAAPGGRPAVAEAPSRNDGVTITCPTCGTAFVPAGRQRFCSAACRQAAWRRRQPAPRPVIPVRVPRLATVYECPVCETRLLGEQRCPDCQVFCRRVGPGGPCPHCEAPVALVDLLDAEPGR